MPAGGEAGGTRLLLVALVSSSPNLRSMTTALVDSDSTLARQLAGRFTAAYAAAAGVNSSSSTFTFFTVVVVTLAV